MAAGGSLCPASSEVEEASCAAPRIVGMMRHRETPPPRRFFFQLWSTMGLPEKLAGLCWIAAGPRPCQSARPAPEDALRTRGICNASKPVSRILSPPRRAGRMAIIPLGPILLSDSSDLPESRLSSLSAVRGEAAALRSGQPLLSYLVLLRVGFTLPRMSPPERCALTLSPNERAAPFHPYPSNDGRYIFCGTFRAGGVRPDESGIPRRPSPLASTLPCGVRTFLSPAHASPDKAHRDARAGQRSPGLLAQIP